MKKSLLFLIFATLSLTMVFSCNKKKDDKAAAPAPEMGATPPGAEMNPAEPVMKEAPKPDPVATPAPVTPPVADPTVTPPTLAAIAELGTPMFAVHVELAKLFESSVFKATGLEDKLNTSMTGDKDFPGAAIGACLGIELKKVTDVISGVTVFGNTDKDVVILASLAMDTGKVFGCLSLVGKGKKTKVDEEMFGTTKGYRITAKDGEVTHLVGVGKNLVLVVVGERKDLIAKLKIGEGNLGKGDVAGYFPGGPQVVKVVLRNLPLEKMNKEGSKVQIPNLKSGDLDGTIALTDTLKVDVKLDTKDAKAAEALVAMGTVMKGLTQIKEEMKAMGLDASLLDAIKIAASGNFATLNVELDAVKAKGLAETLKKQLLDEEPEPVVDRVGAPSPEPEAKIVEPKPAPEKPELPMKVY